MKVKVKQTINQKDFLCQYYILEKIRKSEYSKIKSVYQRLIINTAQRE